MSEWSHRTRIEAMEIANELKALKTDITGGDKGKFDDSKVYDGNKEGFDKWTKRLNEIDAVQCVQYIELLSVIEGQESLTDLLHSLSLNMEWEKAEKALGELNKKDSSVTDSGEFELTEFKSLLSEATSLQIIGHSQLEEGESKRFRKYATTKKFQKPVGILRYLVAGRTEFLHQANFAVTPAVHLIRLPSGELAVLLKFSRGCRAGEQMLQLSHWLCCVVRGSREDSVASVVGSGNERHFLYFAPDVHGPH